jgi:hypothetical protein
LAPELSDQRLHGSPAEFARARPEVAEAIHRSKDGEFHSLGLTLGYHYADSPIVVGGQDPPVAGGGVGPYCPSATPGHRLPHRWLEPGRSIYDRLGKEMTLLGDLGSPAAQALRRAAADLGVPLQAVELAQAEQHLGASLALVRPDQHVAWRGDDAHDPAAVLGSVRGDPAH